MMINRYEGLKAARRFAAAWLTGLLSMAAIQVPAWAEASIRVCARVNPPFLFRDDSDTLRGFEYDLLSAFAADQKVALELIWPERFADVFTMVQANQCDVGAATITKTKARETSVAFSTSYFPVRILLVQRADDSMTVSTDELKGRVAATIAESTYEQALHKIEGIRYKQVPSSLAMFDAVAAGQADFLACDSAIVLALIEDFPNLRIVMPISERDELAFALPKGSTWREPLNDFLARARHDGDLHGYLARYFGKDGADQILAPEDAEAPPK